MELKTIKEKVVELLENNLLLRGDDDLLYCEVCKQIKPDILNMPVCEFFLFRKNYGLPSFESVRRSRQKAQEENPALKPCEEIQKGREKQEEKFKDFVTNYKDLKQQDFNF